MRRCAAVVVGSVLFLSSCATTSFVPPVSSILIERAQSDHITAQQLADGRALFATRCLECHTLPSVTSYRSDQWPRLVSRMAARANLTATDERSVAAYLRAAAGP